MVYLLTINAMALIAFFILTFFIALKAKGKVNNAEDFIVAGRSLPLPILMGTLIATWFGAGSLSVSADAIFHDGLVITGLEPFGVGVCLILAGLFYATRVWKEKALTLADIIRSRFGYHAEQLQVVYGVAYFGWIAVQLLAIGNIIELTFGLDSTTSIILVTTLLTIYTLLGGMWSVAMTDVVQLCMLLIGLLVLTISVFSHLGDGAFFVGLQQLFTLHDAEYLTWIPLDNLEGFNYWLGLFLLGSLGNLASQDVMQRILSARSPSIAKRACISSGFIYIIAAMMPVSLGLAAKLLLPADTQEAVISLLAEQFLHPYVSLVFMLTLTAAITSTVDSALLAPASLFSNNFLRHWFSDDVSTLTLTRYAIVFVAVSSAALALSGTGAIDLLQSSYTLGLPPLVILTFALFQKRKPQASAAIATYTVGLIIWLFDMLTLLLPNQFPEQNPLDTLLPLPLTVLILSVAVYLLTHALASKREQDKQNKDIELNEHQQA